MATSAPAAALPKLIEVRKGRPRLREKPLPLARHPAVVADLARFFAAGTSSDPAGFESLVALHVQESHLSLAALARSIAGVLVPAPIASSSSSSSKSAAAVESWLLECIPRIAQRINYGYNPPDGPSPENLAIWRWEVAETNLFPEDVRTVVADRRAAREAASKGFVAFVDGLAPDARAKLLAAPTKPSVASSPASPQPTIILPKLPCSSSPTASKIASAVTPSKTASASQPTSLLTQLSSPIPSSTQSTCTTPSQSQSKHKADTDILSAAAKEARLREKQLREEEKALDRQRKEDERALKRAEKEKKDAERKAEKEAKETERKAVKAEKEAKEAEERDRKKRKEMAGQKTLKGFFFTVQKSDDADMDVDEVPSEHAEYSSFFRPFHIRDKVTLAPINPLWHSVSVNNALQPADASQCTMKFLEFIKDKNRIVHLAMPRIPASIHALASSSDTVPPAYRPWKLLQFQENVRPAYYGTWSKHSSCVNGRKPFGKDDDVFDYDFDSEAEWEEDEPGEELKSDDEDDEDDDDAVVAGGDDDEEEEDKWLVPHGYLSDDEGVDEDAPPTRPKQSNILLPGTKTDDAQPLGENGGKALAGSSVDSADAPKRKPLEQLVPVIVGPWLGHVDDVMPLSMDFLKSLSVEMIGDVKAPIDPFEAPQTAAAAAKPSRVVQRSEFPEEHVPDLIKAISGRESGIQKLVEDFKLQFPALTKRAIESKIRSIAVRKRLGSDPRARWHLISNLPPASASTTPSKTISEPVPCIILPL